METGHAGAGAAWSSGCLVWILGSGVQGVVLGWMGFSWFVGDTPENMQATKRLREHEDVDIIFSSLGTVAMKTA